MAQAVEKMPEQHTGTAITPAEMINQAITNGAGIEVMEKLMALQERYDATHARKAYDNAIAELRANLPDIVKSQEGYGYKYEDLSDIVRQVSPVMAERGLSFRWRTGSEGKNVTVSCIISHRDGHSEETTLAAQPDTSGSKNSIQAIGSAVTYLQRYTLKAALGIAASKDDDGNAAGKRSDERTNTPQKPQPQTKSNSRETYDRLSKANAKLADVAAFDKFWSQDNVLEAYNSLPNDWAKTLNEERIAMGNELAAQDGQDVKNGKSPADSIDDQFPGDLPKDDHGYTQADYLHAG